LKKHLKEDELRTFLQCARKYQRGNLREPRFHLRVVKRTVEAIIVKTLRNELHDPLRSLQSCLLRSLTVLNKSEHLLEQQLEEAHRHCTMWIDEYLQYLPMHRYYPIIGPFRHRVKAGRATVELEFSGVLKTRDNKTLHVLLFSPYADPHYLLNDPCTYLKLKELDPVVRLHWGGWNTKARAHIFGMTEKHNLTYQTYDTTRLNKNFERQIAAAATLLQNGYSMPTLPCPDRSCKLFNRCNILSAKE